jgi:hypothetical protein
MRRLARCGLRFSAAAPARLRAPPLPELDGAGQRVVPMSGFAILAR